MPRKNRTIKHRTLSTDKFACDKIRYHNENTAKKAADFQMLEKMNVELSVYKCDLCGYWHLTQTNK